ncbi:MULTISPECIES: three-Cys-motif partner protein TcmP [unclassified Methylobacterium]|uniref:three-Cys-motif partner protein TcmP n=1 Tax=unclassified Methylobacterium TaxID=2615210 RepID=UPI0008E05BB0|nr:MULTISPECIES: three-Cys-motif partner protein TcmP [unclassified Methylobacterium]SFU74568.1 three-Cys-motif partner protein [Methylobacterium sp. UNCCL125]
MAKVEQFFDEQTEQSEAKARIVAKYFDAWAHVMLANRRKGIRIDRLGYIDLFAGPGRYKDGAKSTPLLVLEQAVAKPELAEILTTMFNDRDEENVDSLRIAVDALPDLAKLKHKPRIYCGEVGADAEAMFKGIRMFPTFSFADPFGYRGLSRGFVQAMVKDWGCDCVFFFNYGRINAGINNDAVRAHMDALFGRERIDRMRAFMTEMRPNEREAFVLEELASALRDLGAPFILPFRFKRADGSRTSHALVFVSKDKLGYGIMKDIMAKESSTEDEGVPSFTYSPADARCPLLFSLNRPIAALANDLAVRYAGRTMTMKQIYEAHNVNTPFVERNYKRVLNEMENAGRITASPPAAERQMRKGERTFGENVTVTFR